MRGRLYRRTIDRENHKDPEGVEMNSAFEAFLRNPPPEFIKRIEALMNEEQNGSVKGLVEMVLACAADEIARRVN